MVATLFLTGLLVCCSSAKGSLARGLPKINSESTAPNSVLLRDVEGVTTEYTLKVDGRPAPNFVDWYHRNDENTWEEHQQGNLFSCSPRGHSSGSDYSLFSLNVTSPTSKDVGSYSFYFNNSMGFTLFHFQIKAQEDEVDVKLIAIVASVSVGCSLFLVLAVMALRQRSRSRRRRRRQQNSFRAGEEGSRCRRGMAPRTSQGGPQQQQAQTLPISQHGKSLMSTPSPQLPFSTPSSCCMVKSNRGYINMHGQVLFEGEENRAHLHKQPLNRRMCHLDTNLLRSRRWSRSVPSLLPAIPQEPATFPRDLPTPYPMLSENPNHLFPGLGSESSLSLTKKQSTGRSTADFSMREDEDNLSQITTTTTGTSQTRLKGTLRRLHSRDADTEISQRDSEKYESMKFLKLPLCPTSSSPASAATLAPTPQPTPRSGMQKTQNEAIYVNLQDITTTEHYA